MNVNRPFSWAAATLLLAGCAVRTVPPKPAPDPVSRAPAEKPPAPSSETESPKADAAGLVEVFPNVRVDRVAGVVEFDAIVPIDAHDAQTPIVFLELIACIPDTREHESLVMTTAKPSHIHAALLMAGFIPGTPGRKDSTPTGVIAVQPTGDSIDIVLRYQNEAGETIENSPVDWITHEREARRPADPSSRGLWTFSGSVMDRRPSGEVYRADVTGDLIGLATFADETIAWREVFSHQASIDEPVWIADATTVPPARTPVTVRLTRLRPAEPGR